jgi:hypothetical protein
MGRVRGRKIYKTAVAPNIPQLPTHHQLYNQPAYQPPPTVTMFSKTTLLTILALLELSAANPLVPRASTSCSTPSGPGFCELTSSSCSGGKFVAGYCPGAADNQCCVATCSSGKGTCQTTATACSGGSFSSGLCPGPADVQVCDLYFRSWNGR